MGQAEAKVGDQGEECWEKEELSPESCISKRETAAVLTCLYMSEILWSQFSKMHCQSQGNTMFHLREYLVVGFFLHYSFSE